MRARRVPLRKQGTLRGRFRSAMPGLVGLITKMAAQEATSQLRRMASSSSCGPSDVVGTWSSQSLGIYVGWTARKGSFSERMPVLNEQGNVVLAFSGEEFPEPGTTHNLKKRGHEFDVDGPSYLAHLYEEDPSFVAGLNGRFHGLLTDLERGTAMLFNDRYGMHRIYYHESPDAFYFAAEAKAILAVRPELRKANPQSLGEFVSCGAVLENRTLFEGIHVLPPGSSWLFRDGSLVQKDSYFHPREWEEQEELDPETYYQELRRTFTQNLPRYFAGHEQIGMSLTGGLDTRMILAGIRPEPGSLPCYTFGSMFRDNQDVRVARRVAEACGQPHEIITAGREFLSRFPEYASRAVYLSDGCVDISRAPDLYLNERARAIAPVRMTGNYGGEILRGVVAFKPTEPAAGLFCPEFQSCIRQTAETYSRIIQGHPVSFAVFRQAPWYLYSVLALEQTQLTMRSPYLDNDFVRTVFRSPASALASNEVSLRLVADGNRALRAIPTDRGLGGKRGGLSAATIRAAHEFWFKAEYAYDMGMPQWLARVDHTFSAFRLERMFLGRHKPFHFRVWYRDALAGYVQEMLLDHRSLTRPYIERKGLEAMVHGHLRGDRNHTTELHKVLTLELIHRLFLDNAAVVGENPAEKPEFSQSAC
jgi:asparagine synthase (glutamine-hydrolysing)